MLAGYLFPMLSFTLIILSFGNLGARSLRKWSCHMLPFTSNSCVAPSLDRSLLCFWASWVWRSLTPIQVACRSLINSYAFSLDLFFKGGRSSDSGEPELRHLHPLLSAPCSVSACPIRFLSRCSPSEDRPALPSVSQAQVSSSVGIP